jgi:CRP-like cAMP-binding protein
MITSFGNRLGPVERMLVLRSLPALAQLPDEDLAVVASQVSERVFKRGEILLRQGEPVEITHVVVEGRVEIVEHGTVVASSERRIGIGVLAMLGNVHARRSVRAQTDTLVLELHQHRLRDVLEDHYSILGSFIEFVARETIDTYLKLKMDLRIPLTNRPMPVSLPSVQRDLDMVERILVIRQVPAFKRGSLDAVAQYARLLEQIYIPKGEVLWRQGEDCFHYLHMVHGTARCTRDGEQGTLHYSAPGMPGFFGALARTTRWNTAIAETDLVALRADREILPDVLEDNFEMARNFLSAAARRLIQFLELRDR